jgi:hypothetical protein
MHEASVHVSRNRQQLGVFMETQLSLGLAQGILLPSDLCWPPEATS